MMYSSGNFYEGEWSENLKNGYGCMHWKTRGEIYEGQWKDGMPNGEGAYFWTVEAQHHHQYPMQNFYQG